MQMSALSAIWFGGGRSWLSHNILWEWTSRERKKESVLASLSTSQLLIRRLSAGSSISPSILIFAFWPTFEWQWLCLAAASCYPLCSLQSLHLHHSTWLADHHLVMTTTDTATITTTIIATTVTAHLHAHLLALLLLAAALLNYYSSLVTGSFSFLLPSRTHSWRPNGDRCQPKPLPPGQPAPSMTTVTTTRRPPVTTN